MLLVRTRRLIAPVLVALVVLAACGGSENNDAAEQPGSTINDRLAQLAGAGVFVGGVAMTGNLVAIHFDRADPASPGMRVLVTDGLPNGNAEWFEGKASGGAFRFTSTSGNATIEGKIEPFDADGTVTLADGAQRNFFTRPAGDGAGIFEVTVAGDGSWKGMSLDGSTLDARQTEEYVEGNVVSTVGERYPFRHNDLTRRLGYGIAGGAPDTYLTIVTRQATEIQGRGGDVRGGNPSANIVALDLDQGDRVTPGVFHGRVADATDRLNFEVKTNPDGSRLVRSYVSDSEPEPAGDIQWFVDTVTGSDFALTSKNGDARITGTIADDGISGDLTLTDGVARRYFAAPSGQGAGIYTVEVGPDRRHTGTSEQGAKLDLRYENGTVMGTLASPEGEQFPMLGADLASAYRYDDEYSKPGTYTAFVAPRGRYVFGRQRRRAGRPARGEHHRARQEVLTGRPR
ncbi:MAG: hypothetical protein ACR2HV_02185 [Acidimicrobiales bacterium]